MLKFYLKGLRWWHMHFEEQRTYLKKNLLKITHFSNFMIEVFFFKL